MFPALPALAILLALGLNGWRGTTRSGKQETGKPAYAAALLIVLLAGLALWLPFGVIRPAYPFHTLPEQNARAQIGTAVYGRYGVPGEEGAELLGWRIAGALRPGDTPMLTLIWHARGRQNRDWTVFVHVVDDQEQIVAEDNRPPLDGAFPMLQWITGDWLADQHPIALPANLAPGSYHLRVGLFDTRTERRAGVYSKRNRLKGDYLDIGSITVGS